MMRLPCTSARELRHNDPAGVGYETPGLPC
jgi:hypothetical protein